MRTITSICLVGVLLSSCTSSKKSGAPSSRPKPLPSLVAGSLYHPAIDPSNFTAEVDNPWFPLKAGTTFVYTGTKDGKPARDVYTVTSRTIVVGGVTCRVVHDELFLAGKLEERTDDYYSQDQAGNVWYFGEDTAELDALGNVTTTEGSWHAGVNGAQPGVFMEADPQIGHAYRQEYYAGQAEDQYEVLSLTDTIKVPYGSFRNVLRTKETTTLEPDVVDNKYYVRGVGEVEEIAIKGPLEKAVLVGVTTS